MRSKNYNFFHWIVHSQHVAHSQLDLTEKAPIALFPGASEEALGIRAFQDLTWAINITRSLRHGQSPVRGWSLPSWFPAVKPSNITLKFLYGLRKESDGSSLKGLSTYWQEVGSRQSLSSWATAPTASQLQPSKSLGVRSSTRSTTVYSLGYQRSPLRGSEHQALANFLLEIDLFECRPQANPKILLSKVLDNVIQNIDL